MAMLVVGIEVLVYLYLATLQRGGPVAVSEAAGLLIVVSRLFSLINVLLVLYLGADFWRGRVEPRPSLRARNWAFAMALVLLLAQQFFLMKESRAGQKTRESLQIQQIARP